MNETQPAIPDYEALLEKYYTGFLKPGDVCIDIGAHQGRHMYPMLDRVGRGGKILAFEPIPELAAKLEADVVKGGLEQTVSVLQMALSDEAGTATFVVAVDALAYSGLRERVYDVPTATREIKVVLSTLDEVVGDGLDSVDYVKIDAEGAEWSILQGARKTLARYRPVVTFEFGEASYQNYGVVPEEVHDFWRGLGYRVFDIRGRELDRESFALSAVRQEIWDYTAIASGRDPAALLQPLLEVH